MPSRVTIVAALLGTGAVLAVLQSCRGQDVLAFTTPPAKTALKAEPRIQQTAVYAGMAVEPQEALTAAEAALPHKLAHVSELVANAACGRRPAGSVGPKDGAAKDECASARIEGDITRAGAIELTAVDGNLVLKVPFTYSFTVRGQGWASAIEDKKSGQFSVSSRIEPLLQANYRVDLAADATQLWSERHVAVGNGQLDLVKHVQAKVQLSATTFQQSLAASLATQLALPGVQRVWQSLQQPVALSKAPELWLSAEPVRTAGGGFVQEGQTLIYRVAIGVRARLLEAKPATTPQPRAGASAAHRLPEPTRATPEMATTQLRLPMLIGLARLQTAAARAFPAKERLISQNDRFSEPMETRTQGAEVYPANRQLVLALDLDITAPKSLSGRKGRLHLLGRPVLDPAGQTLTVDNISMPAMTARETRETKLPAPAGLQPGLEPYGQRFAEGLKIDVGPDVRTAVALANGGIERRADDGVSMTARFDGGQAVAVETIGEGVALYVAVTGQLLFVADGTRIESTAASARLPGVSDAPGAASAQGRRPKPSDR